MRLVRAALWWALLLGAWVALPLASARAEGATSPAEPAPPATLSAPVTLTLGMPLEPPGLDPTAGPAAAIDEVVYANVFEGLTRIGPRGEVLPGLAASWSPAPGGLSWSFTLRPGVAFHDGRPFDAEVARFSLTRAIAPGSLNAAAERLRVIDRVEVTGPLALILHLRRPAADLPRLLGLGDAVMVHPESAATNRTRPVGTGPFHVLEWRFGDRILLARNPAYWGTPAQLDLVTFRIVPDSVGAFTALRAGDIDGFPNFPAAETLGAFRDDPRFSVVIGSTEGETLLAINNARPPFDDVRVRRALAHAIDRDALIAGPMSGFGQRIGSHFPPHSPDWLDLNDRYPYDPDRARALLAEAGYPDGFATTLRLPPVPYARRGGEAIQAMLARVGIRAEIRTVEWAQWLEQVFANGDYDLTIVSHTEALDYDIYGRDGYYFNYTNPGYRALLERLEVETDPAARRLLLHGVQRVLAEDAVNVFLFQLPKVGVWRADVTGLWADAPIQAVDLTAVARAGQTARGTPPPEPAQQPVTWVLASVGILALLTLWVGRRHLGPLWLLRRLLVVGLTLLAAAGVIFALTEILPGDPATAMLGLEATEDAKAALRAELGLTGDAWTRFSGWLAGVVQGDFGLSYTYRVPVAELVADRLAVTLPLAALALALTVAIALPLGAWAAARRGRLADGAMLGVTGLALAVPNFWLGVLLILAFAIALPWFPSGGFPGWEAGPLRALAALILPALALAIPQAAILARIVRTAVLETLGQDYVRTARAKGLSARAALWRHALPNALVPVLTVAGLQLSFLIAGAILVERVFGLPGLGLLVFQAVEGRDLITVRSVVLLLVMAVVVVTALVDLAAASVDPRLARPAGRAPRAAPA